MTKKILLIDDSEMVLQILGAIIEDMDYELETATDGMEGLEELTKTEYSQPIFLDQSLSYSSVNSPLVNLGEVFNHSQRELISESDIVS